MIGLFGVEVGDLEEERIHAHDSRLFLVSVVTVLDMEPYTAENVRSTNIASVMHRVVQYVRT